MQIVLDWLKANQPDVMCLQETKVVDADFPLQPLVDAGYYVTFRGMKAYNGVATLSIKKPEAVLHGFCEGPDSEDFRLLKTTIDGVTVINTYVPQGFAIDSPKYQYKLNWYKRLQAYFDEHMKGGQPVVWLGDMNVAPGPLDVHSPEKHLKHPCYHADAQDAYRKTVEGRFVDTFRALHPNEVQYTFWDFFSNSFATNKGWRIDHIMTTHDFAKRCRSIQVDLTPRKAESPSDHTVLWADFS